MNKANLRQSTITGLKELEKKHKQWIEMKLFQHLIALDSWNRSMIVGLTVSQGIEWDTRLIIETAWDQGKTVCVPKCYPEKQQMIFYHLEEWGQLEHAYADILEPLPCKTIPITKSQIELLIVPGLLFNKQGFRIGFGGVYYDRFLQDFPNETISLTSENQVVEHLPVDPFDIPVHQILTEKGLVQEEL